MAHADLDWMVLKKMLEEGKAETRPGFNLEYCMRMGTAYFAWFFEGVYQYDQKRRVVQSLTMAENPIGQELSPRPLMRILGDFANSQILDAALEYDFFTLIHKGFKSAEEIARRSRYGCARDAHCARQLAGVVGLIEKRDGKYFLTPTAEAFLVKANRPIAVTFVMLRWHCGTAWRISKNRSRPASR